MRSTRVQLLVTLIATAVAAWMLVRLGPLPSVDLFDAAYYGNTEQVLRHIRWGSDLDRAYPAYYEDDGPIVITPLWEAWDGAQMEMIDFLHEHGAREHGIRWRRTGAWYQLLPGDLQEERKRRPEMPAFAPAGSMWPRRAALSVVRWLCDRQVAVLRVEVFLPGAQFGEELGPFGRHLTPKRLDGERWTDFVERVNAGAAEYIRSFTWDEKDAALRGREPHFALLLISRREYESPLPGDLDVE